MIDIGNMLIIDSGWTVVPADPLYAVRVTDHRRAFHGWSFLPLCWIEAIG